jgi:hypothetical protein
MLLNIYLLWILFTFFPSADLDLIYCLLLSSADWNFLLPFQAKDVNLRY